MKKELTEYKKGDKLTWDLTGEKVEVREVVTAGGYWAWWTWVPLRVIGFKLVNKYGIWFLMNFTETKS